MADIQNMMKKEQIQQLSEAFGRKLPDSKINQLLKNLENSMMESKDKSKNKKK